MDALRKALEEERQRLKDDRDRFAQEQEDWNVSKVWTRTFVPSQMAPESQCACVRVRVNGWNQQKAM